MAVSTGQRGSLPGDVVIADRVVGGVCVAATIAAFVLSYRNLLDYASQHGGYPLWLAVIWPLIIDLFVIMGEGRLYSATRVGEPWHIKARMWVLTLLGLGASMAANWYHYEHAPLSYNLAAVAAPAAAAAGLAVGLGLVKRYSQPVKTGGKQAVPAGTGAPAGTGISDRPAGAASRPARRSATPADPSLVALLVADLADGKSLAWRQVVDRHGVSQHAARKAIPLARSQAGNGQGSQVPA